MQISGRSCFCVGFACYILKLASPSVRSEDLEFPNMFSLSVWHLPSIASYCVFDQMNSCSRKIMYNLGACLVIFFCTYVAVKRKR